MSTRISHVIVSAVLTIASGAGVVSAQVGDPTGTFGIRITQGSSVVVDNPSVTVPADIFLPIRDGTPEGFVQIGTIGPLNSPIILKMVSDPDPDFRIVHWYVDVPLSVGNIDLPGATSLFDPSNPASIDVEITGLDFDNGASVVPLLVNNDTYLTAFMRDRGGVFYNLPSGKTLNYPGPATEVQVAASRFCDGNAGQYGFDGWCMFGSDPFPGFQSGGADFAWRNIPNPGATTTTNNGFNPNKPSFGNGYVFELGLSVAFLGIPEPGTIGLLAVGVIPVLFRRRRRRR
ncbi:MAG: PEP-CTERM sorting domain-containing protein [Phycisphaerae bacterium]